MNWLKYDKIPIWENRKRIKDLTLFRDLWLHGLLNAPMVGAQKRATLRFLRAGKG
jgi:hypothetical protein